jgi:hypothetical protein
MPEQNLSERIEKYTKIIGKRRGISDSQIQSIISLIKTIRTEGAISDEDLSSYFEMVGE